MKIEDGHQPIMPYLIVEGADKLINFLKLVFDAKEKLIIPRSEGVVMHAEITIGEATVMIADATAEFKPITAGLYIYVEDTDKTYKEALNAGATSVMAPYDAEYGARGQE